jgi:hypothetical protein
MSPLISLLPPLWSGDSTKHDVTCKRKKTFALASSKTGIAQGGYIDEARALRVLLAGKARALLRQHEHWLAAAKAGRLLVSL